MKLTAITTSTVKEIPARQLIAAERLPMKIESILYLMPLLPFLGFLTNGLLGKRIPKAFVGPIACIGPLIAFAIAFQGFIEVRPEAARALSNPLGDWMRVAGTSVALAFSLDKFQAVLALVVTGVGSLIHIYSVGYMRDDAGYARFFAYMNFFMAAMLVLVLADNLVLCFLGWEGVGLASYLLIGFWFDDEANAAAGRKAFVVNRIGDFGFILGIFLVSISFGTVRFAEIAQNERIAAVAPGVLTAIALLLFLGATGKSAQIPLYVWLPDAMAGPTPVSALIHAATMVTSGVFVLARLQPIYAAAPGAQAVVAAIGGVTALVAGFIALSQFDIKKVLAYSTVSQLGYMFLAAGLGQGAVAVYHLVTHAFFKALLFLGAGAMIHSLHHEQDLRRMGGLRKSLPRTFAVFLVGSLAIAGFPFFSGFFSKDAILDAAWHKGFGPGGGAGWIALWAVALITAAMTSFYTFRLVALAFFGKERWKELPAAHGADHGHGDARHSGGPAPGEVRDAPPVMLAPLYVLAFLSVIGGFIDVPGFLTGRHEPHGWIAPLTGTAAFLAGLFGAWRFYGRGADEERGRVFAAAPPLRALHALSAGKLFVDEIYGLCVVKPLQALASGLYYLVDCIIIDLFLVEGLGGAARGTGAILRRLQTGMVPSYATWFIAGVVAILAAIAITGVR